MKAAVFQEANKPLTIEDVDIVDPRAGEVLVRTVCSGVCHSDLHFVDGLWQLPSACVLGHEAAGIVEAVGDGVTYVKPGDRVIIQQDASTFVDDLVEGLLGPVLTDRRK